MSDQPQVKAASAQLRQAYLNVQRAAIVAPISGFVGKRAVQLGQRVQPGTTLMTVVPLEQVWVEANFKETQIGPMAVGQSAELIFDAYPDTPISARVDSLFAASGAQFSLLPPDNATGNFVKIAQRVPVRIIVDPDQAESERLRPGLSVVVSIDTAGRLKNSPP